MLTLLVPGVGMSGDPGGAAPAGGVKTLMLLGVGRVFYPFLLIYEVFSGR